MDKLIEYGDKKEKVLGRDDISVPEGWLWKEEWSIDHNRAVDSDGKGSLLVLDHIHDYFH